MTTPRIPLHRTGEGKPLGVLAVVGADVHRFDRLMNWLERWWETRPDHPRLVVQYGRSRRPDIPGAVEFLGHEQLTAAMAEAVLVVSHAGPATITEARRTGHLPIVVPRDPKLREHVDNHQQLFARRLDQENMIKLCDTEAALVAALDAGLADPGRFRFASNLAEQSARAKAVARVGTIIDELVAARSRRPRAGTARRHG